MSNNFVIRKNTIEIKRERLIIHRNQVSCITYIDPIEGEVPYCVGLWFNPPIVIQSANGENQYIYKYIYVYCDDYLPFVEWFDYDEQKFFETTLEKHKHTAHYLEPLFREPTLDSETQSINSVVRHPCICCREQLPSVCERPQFENKLLCNLCNNAQIYLAKEDN